MEKLEERQQLYKILSKLEVDEWKAQVINASKIKKKRALDAELLLKDLNNPLFNKVLSKKQITDLKKDAKYSEGEKDHALKKLNHPSLVTDRGDYYFHVDDIHFVKKYGECDYNLSELHALEFGKVNQLTSLIIFTYLIHFTYSIHFIYLIIFTYLMHFTYSIHF